MSIILPNDVSNYIQEKNANANIIWFDASVNTNDEIEKIKEDLQSMNNCLRYHNNFDTFNDYIESINKKNLFCIISGISGNETLKLLSSIHKTSLLTSVFVVSDHQEEFINLKEKFHRKVNICGNYIELMESIKENIIDVNNQMKMFSFYDRHEQSILDLSDESAKFLWFQLFNDVILHLPRDDEAKEEMMNTCRQYYRDNQIVLEKINQFNQTYQKEKSIQWYTEDTFVYRLINRALRTEDLEQLYIFRYYIASLSSELQLAHQSQKSERKLEHLYRGMIITKNEAETLRTNKDKLIAVNGYWSTSRNESCALVYIDGYPIDTDKIPVLFKIECDLQDEDESVIFADLQTLGLSSEEEEVLFDVGAVFKIESVKEEKIENSYVLVVQMRISREGREIAQKYKEENRKKMKDESPTIMLCTLLKRMSKIEKSLILLEQLLQNPGNENKAHIHNRIAIALKVKNRYELALDNFNTAYELINSSKPLQPKYAALILYNRGRLYDKMKNFKEALNDSENALEILKNEIGTEDGNVAKLYSSIGRIYYHKGLFEESFKYQIKALDIRNEYLSVKPVVIAFSYSDIARIYSHQNDYDQALKYHLHALKLREESLPADHHTIAWSLHQIGKMFKGKGNRKLALKYHGKSLSISEKYVSSSLYYLTLDTLNDIILLINGDELGNILMYRLKALKIQRNIQPIDYLSLASNLEKIASIYKSMGNLNNSLQYYKDIVEVRQEYLSNNYDGLASSFYDLASIYDKMGENTTALEYYNKERKIYADNGYPRTLHRCKNANNNINRIEQLIKEKKNS